MRHVILSDIHANEQALQAVVHWVESRGKPVRYWCLGDVIGYGPRPVNTVAWVVKHCSDRFVVGNHDVWLLENIRRHLPYNGLARTLLMGHEWALKQHPEILNSYLHLIRHSLHRSQHPRGASNEVPLAGLLCHKTRNLHVFFTHGVAFPPEDRFKQYLRPWNTHLVSQHLNVLETYRQENNLAAALLFTGHTHFPFVVKWEEGRNRLVTIRYGEAIDVSSGSWLIGVGAVGQPRDGDPRASFAVLDTRQKNIMLIRQKYDLDRVEMAFNASEMLLPAEQIQVMMRRLRTGDGKGEDAMRFATIYTPQAWGLEAVSQI